ncbi:MAG: hypothetical protein V8S34_01050 [Lawsonibacter sp.]
MLAWQVLSCHPHVWIRRVVEETVVSPARCSLGYVAWAVENQQHRLLTALIVPVGKTQPLRPLLS